MTATQYLCAILAREQVDTSANSPAHAVAAEIVPHINTWSNGWLDNIWFSGSYAKNTANISGTDLDLFISIKRPVPETLESIYDKLVRHLRSVGYQPRPRNVAVNILVQGWRVDLVPGRRQSDVSADHSLHHKRPGGEWIKTNIHTHISYVAGSGRASEIRIIKLWRDQHSLEFPSFNIELAVIDALSGHPFWFHAGGDLGANVLAVLDYLSQAFKTAVHQDPANTNNRPSDDLSAAQKILIASQAGRSRRASSWAEIVA